MTERMIENRVKKLSALEEQIAQLQEQAEAIKGELKADLEEKGLLKYGKTKKKDMWNIYRNKFGFASFVIFNISDKPLLL